MVILGAIKEAGSTETVRPAETIRGNAWCGVTGELEFDHKGNRKISHIIWVVKNGQFVRYWDPLTGKYF
jgi:ABC-type branched-subunit amino acid transport system substrate-binding protein